MSDKKISKKGKLKAVIIGAGRIASGFDNPTSREVLTHAHAYNRHKSVVLAGFFDINQAMAKSAARKWSSDYFLDFDTMFKAVIPDIVSVCTPDENHFATIKKILPYKPALIICEKPITASVKDTKELIILCKKNKINVLVNFSRRFDSTIQIFKEKINQGAYGKVLCAAGIYGKGARHNGSHLVDLARYLFGEVKNVKSLYSINDYKKGDRTIAGFLRLERCPQFHLLVSDQRAYSIFELDILFEKGRVRLFDSGFKIIVQSVQPDSLYKGFFGLTAGVTKDTGLKQALFKMVDVAVKNILDGGPLICDITDAFATQKIVENLSHNY